MATRYADLKFRVTGGDKLQREIKTVNAELQKLKNQSSELKAKFAGQENSEVALAAKTANLSKEYSALQEKLKFQIQYLSNAQDALEKTTTQYDRNTDELERTKHALEVTKLLYPENTKLIDGLSKSIDRLTSEHNVLDKALTTGEARVKKAEGDIAKTNESLAQTGTLLQKAKGWLKEAQTSFDGCAKSINEYGEEVDKSNDAIDAMALAIAASGIKQGLDEIKQALIDCVNASAEFESALTGVAKTTSLSGESLVQFGEDLKEMSTRIPMSAASLAEIAAMAGQLGIADENIKSFTETIAALSVATNIQGAEGAENLARFMNIMQTSQGDVDRLGAAIVDLGNNFATTEDEILTMAMNLAGAGKQAGLTEADVLGIATAISSVGIAAGKGGTAFSKALINMQLAVATGSEKLNDFAEVAGMTSEEFAKLFNDNAIDAVQRFFVGLGNGSKPAIELLSEMGVSEVRLRDTMLRLSNATDLFTGAIEMSNEAFASNTALVHEANLFYGTTQSQTEILKNSFDNLKVAVGDSLNPALNELKQTGIDVLKTATDFVKNNPALVKVIATVVTSLSTFVGVIMTATVAVKALDVIQKTLNITMLANPYLMLATALATLVGVLTACALKTESVNERVKELNSNFDSIVEGQHYMTESFNGTLAKMEATRSVADEYIGVLQKLEEQTSLTDQEQQIYADTVDKIKALYPDLEIEIDETTGLIKDGSAALIEQIDAWEKNAEAAARAEYIKQMAEAVTKAEIELRTTELKLKDASDSLKQVRDERVEVEKQLLEQMGFQADSYEALTYEERMQFDATVGLNEKNKELYDKWKDLQSEEENLETKVKDLTEAVGDQEEGLADLQEDLGYAKQAVQETGEAATTAGDSIRKADWAGALSAAVDGIVAQAEKERARAEAAGRTIGNAVIRGYEVAHQIASPSKVFKQLAHYDVEGLIQGTEDEKQRLEEAYSNLATRTTEAFTNASQTINNTSSATFTVNTTSLSPDMVDYLYGEFNRRLNRV